MCSHPDWIRPSHRHDPTLCLKLRSTKFLSVKRTKAPALLPIFRSRAQAELLTRLYLYPGREFSLTDLARRVEVSVPTVHREVVRLAESRLLTETTLGRNRMLGANPAHPAAESLGRLLEVTFGPRHVTEEFAGVAGSDRVLIFGSSAARYFR